MRRITDVKELRQLQIAILDNVVAFCNERGISYSLAGGTLIGALRHKGYIPWDDDIDLYMLRKDYEIFAKTYQDSTGRYVLMSPEKSKNYLYTFGKVVDKQTLMIEDEVKEYKLGVNVDIFPIDFVPEDMSCRIRLYKWKRLLHKIRRCKMSNKNYLSSALAFYCYKWMPIPLSAINAIMNRYIFSRKPTSMVCDMHNAGLPPRCAFSYSAMTETVDVEFEGKLYKAMSGYDEYLTNTFGNYMQLPPENQRVHHHFKAYML